MSLCQFFTLSHWCLLAYWGSLTILNFRAALFKSSGLVKFLKGFQFLFVNCVLHLTQDFSGWVFSSLLRCMLLHVFSVGGALIRVESDLRCQRFEKTKMVFFVLCVKLTIGCVMIASYFALIGWQTREKKLKYPTPFI